MTQVDERRIVHRVEHRSKPVPATVRGVLTQLEPRPDYESARPRRNRVPFIESLVIFDVSLVIGATAAASLLWPLSGSTIDPWATIIAGIFWLVCLAGVKGFAAERLAKPLPMIAAWAGSAVLASAAMVQLFFGDLLSLRRPMILALVLTVSDIVGRAVIRRFHHRRVISVLPAHRYHTDKSKGRLQNQTLVLTDELQKNPEELIRLVSQRARFSSADVVELPANLAIDQELIDRLSWDLRKQHVTIRLVRWGTPVSSARIRTHSQGEKTMLEMDAPYPHLPTRMAKRALDVAGSGFLILALAPLFAALAVAIKLSSRGPVFYRQKRIGIDGRPFGILKFRSMVPDADAQLQSLLHQQGRSDKPLFKLDDDPRVTRIGAVMRRYSLDELPQLFNVFGGSMSLVGPRPQRPAEVALYDKTARQRLGVLPGMTGMWQVNGRSRLGWDEAIALDLYYTHNWSLSQDLSILAKTASAVVRGDGAQ